MKSRNIKSERISENYMIKSTELNNLKNFNNILTNPQLGNNISEIQPKESFNSQKFQNSIISLDISFNQINRNKEDDDNYNLYKQYLLSKAQYNKILSEIANIDKKYINNENSIKKLEKELQELKQEKRQKKLDIVDLLSNKESIEEIYKIKISSLKNNYKIFEIPNIKRKFRIKSFNKKNIKIDINDKINDDDNNNNEYNPFETINILNDNDSNNVEIKIDDIKISDQKKYEEQLTNFCDDIFQKNDLDIKNKLIQKMKIGYQVFFSEIKAPMIESEKTISNFFSKISVFISNKNKGKFPIPFINSFLKQLLKINSINVRISKILSFLNKKYNEKKNEIKQKINYLNEKNENLKTKKKAYNNKKKELKNLIDENRDKAINIEKNRIKKDMENTECMSFLLDNYFQDELDNSNEIYELPEPIKINGIFLKDKNNYLENNKNGNNNNNYQNEIISYNDSKEGFRTENKNINKILNLTNCKINNEFNNETDEGIIEKKDNQILRKFNSFIINKIPFSNNNKAGGFKNKNRSINKNINSINVNNLIINNNLNIENENIINNKKEQSNNNDAEKCNIEQCIKKNILNNNLNNYNYNSYKTEVKESTNHNKKRIIMIRDMKIDYLQKMKYHKSNNHISPKNLNRLNNNNAIFLPMNNSKTLNKSKSPSNSKSIINTNIIPSPRINNLAKITQGLSECFCYFKLSDKSSNGFTPLNNTDINPVSLNYFEGSIKIEKIFNKLKITPKNENKYIGIELKDILNISLNKQMENIVKIYNLYLRERKNLENLDINKFILIKEIKEIRMQQNEKIKAVNCKRFSFSILLDKKFIPKVEFIFNNYEDFNSWYNCLQSIVKLNSPDKEKK